MKKNVAKLFFTICIIILVVILYFIYISVPYIHLGGFLMIPLMFCSVYGLFIIIERYIYLKKVEVNSDDLLSKMNKAIAENNISEAYLLCENNPSILTPILLAGLNNYSEPKEKIKEALQDAGLQVIPKLEENLNLLLLIARISPLLGLLGTVTGLISAFNQVLRLGGNVNASALAGGISEALLTTAAGLIIALPVIVFHNHLAGKVEKIIRDLEYTATLLIESITKQRKEQKND